MRELQEWYALSGELDPSGFEAGTSAKRLVRTLLERASASRQIQNISFQAKESKTLTGSNKDVEDLIVELLANHTIG